MIYVRRVANIFIYSNLSLFLSQVLFVVALNFWPGSSRTNHKELNWPIKIVEQVKIALIAQYFIDWANKHIQVAPLSEARKKN